MFVVMLQGPESCGKTTTLNKVYAELESRGATVFRQKKPLGNPKQNDFEAMLNYTSGATSIKIGFFTMGDYSEDIIKAIPRYVTSTDVFILACNDDKFAEIFDAIINNRPDIFIKMKSVQPPPNQDADDTRIAQTIIEIILQAI
jgi:polyphosphate kinase 2 (PPK2 family)